MSRVKFKGICLFLVIICAITPVFSVSCAAIYCDENSTVAFSGSGEYYDTGKDEAVIPCGKKISSRFYELLFDKEENKQGELTLIPGGDVFGIKIKETGVTVSDSEESSVLRRGDKILAINDKAVRNAEDVSLALSDCRGGTLKIDIVRGGEKMTVTAVPKYIDGGYKLGVTLRKSACGIGTVTFINPRTNEFGGLGHGVCDPHTKAPVEIEEGEVLGVVLGGINRGEVGKPGELSGVLNKTRIGEIKKNNECGVFGVIDDASTYDGTPIPVGRKEEVRLGDAEIISTVKNGKKASYKIEITEIDRSSTGSKSFKIKVADPTLIALTGGIVRGMSGSPIIQDGKLVGAVTHVMVANPTEGYGIFIENMLSAAENQVMPKAA